MNPRCFSWIVFVCFFIIVVVCGINYVVYRPSKEDELNKRYPRIPCEYHSSAVQDKGNTPEKWSAAQKQFFYYHFFLLRLSISCLKLFTSVNCLYTLAKRMYATSSSSRNSFITYSPMRLLGISCSPLLRKSRSILCAASSISCVLTGRFSHAVVIPRSSLFLSKSSLLLSRLMMRSACCSTRSYVVNRCLQLSHSLLLRVVSPASRVSITRVLLSWQYAHFIG